MCISTRLGRLRTRALLSFHNPTAHMCACCPSVDSILSWASSVKQLIVKHATSCFSATDDFSISSPAVVNWRFSYDVWLDLSMNSLPADCYRQSRSRGRCALRIAFVVNTQQSLVWRQVCDDKHSGFFSVPQGHSLETLGLVATKRCSSQSNLPFRTRVIWG